MKFAQTVLAASLAMIVAAQAHAAVSPQNAAKLGSNLPPLLPLWRDWF